MILSCTCWGDRRQLFSKIYKFFCDYIGISIEDFHQKCIEIVNKELFVLDEILKLKDRIRC